MKKVLIVDDSKISRKTNRKILEALEYEVVGEAVDGNDGLQQYKNLQPNMIIVDIEMPNLDGITMMKKIRSEDNDIKMIVVSSIVNAQAMQEVVKLRVSVVKKPVKQVQLQNAIKLFDR